MKYKHSIAVIGLISIACFIAATIGCAGGSERVVADMMREIPENASVFSFWDIRLLRGDNDLVNYYQEWSDYYQYTLDDYGIVTDDLNHIGVSISSDDRSFSLNYGDFDFNEMKAKRDSPGFDEYLYLDVEVWERPGEWLVGVVKV